MTKKVELLAPAGDLEKLKMAIHYGADAVFVGTKEYSLRSRASNFPFEDLCTGAQYAHERNAKLYVTMNIVPHNEDLVGLVDYLIEIEKAGVDAIICTSMAIIDTAKRCTNLAIHISTQQSVTNSFACDFLYAFGASRVILARELSIAEIRNIRENTIGEIEVFIHGGLCCSYSGRCMLSNNLANRDANRGGCAHSCRWNYELFAEGESLGTDPFFSLSSKDLNSLHFIPELLDIGVNSLKIEGRMKSLHYVATVTKVYREVIDLHFQGEKIDFIYYEEELRKAENRLTSKGSLAGPPSDDEQLFGMRSERASQVFVGIVKSYDSNTQLAVVEVRNHFKNGALLEVFKPRGRNSYINALDLQDINGNTLDAARHPLSLVTIKSSVHLEYNDILRLAQKAIPS